MTDRMNMLRIDAPAQRQRQGIDFDPQRDIVPHFVQSQTDALKDDRSGNNWSEFTEIAAALKIIDPAIRTGMTEDDIRIMRQYTNMWNTNTSTPLGWRLQGKLGANLKLIGIDPKMAGRPWDSLRDTFSEFVEEQQWANVVMLAFHMKIIRPDDPGAIALSDDDWKKIHEWFFQQEQGRTSAGEKAVDLARIKVIDPTRMPQLPRNFYPYLREDFKLYFDAECEKPGSQIKRYRELLVAMKILAADEVKITETGIEFVMPSNYVEEAPPLPEQLTV